jgi:RNA-directed DNA polymerase
MLDRFIEQAVMQVLQRSWDGTFSEHSYGFRPKRSAHQAVEQARQYQAEGYRWVVDLDLGKFFERVNPDRLLAKIAERVSDKRAAVWTPERADVHPVDAWTPFVGLHSS